MKKLTYILTISILILSCNSKEDYIQNVYVDEYVYLDHYSEDLNISGSAIFTKGGVEGIIIYRGFGDDYKVYDRNCSYEPSLSCSVIDSVNSGIAFCRCCTSMFNISNTGESINAPALLPLKTYNWKLTESNVMHIYN
tara:strand:+ start:94 stop:507 length:414 start_codon:yes stop_codon:yes gene_type:complete